VIEVAEPSWQTHDDHGDHDYIDCSSNADCSGYDTCGGGGVEGQCGCTPTTCPAGSCGWIDDGCGGTLDCGACSNCPVITLAEPACFWLGFNDGVGKWCWIQADQPDGTLADCQYLDSCSPGGGDRSAGGCYTWAASSDTQSAPGPDGW
jgi:hypothetical protein